MFFAHLRDNSLGTRFYASESRSSDKKRTRSQISTRLSSSCQKMTQPLLHLLVLDFFPSSPSLHHICEGLPTLTCPTDARQTFCFQTVKGKKYNPASSSSFRPLSEVVEGKEHVNECKFPHLSAKTSKHLSKIMNMNNLLSLFLCKVWWWWYAFNKHCGYHPHPSTHRHFNATITHFFGLQQISGEHLGLLTGELILHSAKSQDRP